MGSAATVGGVVNRTRSRTRSGLPVVAAKRRQSSQNAARLAERRARVFELHKVGWPFRRIAEELDIGVATAHDDFRQAMEDLLPVEEVEEVRRLEVDRLDHWLVIANVIANDPDTDHDTRMKAVDRGLAIQARRAKYLGLDAPTKIEGKLEHTVETTMDRALRDLVAEMRPDVAERADLVDG